jgi:hypothetical protein
MGRVEVSGFGELCQGFICSLRRVLKQKRPAAQAVIIAYRAFRGLAFYNLCFSLDQSRCCRTHNTCRDAVLQIENFLSPLKSAPEAKPGAKPGNIRAIAAGL